MHRPLFILWLVIFNVYKLLQTEKKMSGLMLPTCWEIDTPELGNQINYSGLYNKAVYQSYKTKNNGGKGKIEQDLIKQDKIEMK